MPTVDFVGQSAQTGASPAAGTSRLLNLYREPVTEGDNTRYLLRSVPGQNIYTAGYSTFMRAIQWVDGQIYIVTDGSLSTLSEGGYVASVGAIADDVNTTISGNLGYVTVVAGGNYYTWNGTTMLEPPDGAFENYGSVDTLGQRMLLTEKNGRRFQWSDVADPDTLGGLNFATTEAGEDNNIRGVVLNGNYWIFKERSIEIWYQTGASDDAQAFARVSGGIVTTGLKEFNLLTKIRGGLFFVGNDNIAYVTTGAGLQPVSTPPVARSIADNIPTHCFYYEHEGHKFCVIRFTDRPAWVYDFSTQEWHERSEGANHGPWAAVDTTQDNQGEWIVVGDGGFVAQLSKTRSGLIYDREGPLYRRAISRTLRNDSKRFRVPEVEFYADYGRAETDAETQLMAQFSGDRGNTWQSQRSMTLGNQGNYDHRVLFRSLGQFRHITARVDMTHKYEIPIWSDVRVRLA
jgi:hypothetical protein